MLSESGQELDISLVLCTKDRADSLERCLAEVEKQDCHLKWELVVVDNASTDETPDVIEKWARKFPVALKLVREEAPGTGFARNAGWRAAGGKIIVYTDDDCYPAKDFLQSVYRCFHDNEIDYLSGRILLFDNSDFKIAVTEWAEPIVLKPYSFISPGLVKCANCAFMREALETVGGFDPSFGAGACFAGEDVEVVGRMAFAGKKGLYSPKPLVYHHHGRNTEAKYEALKRTYDEGRGACMVKGLLNKRMRKVYFKSWCWKIRDQSLVTTYREFLGAGKYILHLIRKTRKSRIEDSKAAA